VAGAVTSAVQGMTLANRGILSGMTGTQTQMTRLPFGMKMQNLSQYSGLSAELTALSLQKDKGEGCRLIRTENLAVTEHMALRMKILLLQLRMAPDWCNTKALTRASLLTGFIHLLSLFQLFHHWLCLPCCWILFAYKDA